MTFILSMLPIIELRGAIPYGVINGLELWYSFILAFLGNLLPVPFIVLFIRRVFEWLRTKSKWLESLVGRFETKTMKRHKLIYRSELIGLLVLVAIPLPGTGAWTGALLAALLNLRLKTAFPVIALGVLIAGLVVMLVTHGFAAVVNAA